MKIYIISEDHELNKQEREETIPKLLDAGFYVGKEGHHQLCEVDGAFGLDDVMYGIYTEVTMVYLSIIEGNANGVQNAISQLNEISSVVSDQGILHDLEILINKDGGIQTAKKFVLREIKELSECFNSNGISEKLRERALDVIKYFKEIILNYFNNSLYLGEGVELKEEHYKSLSIEALENFPRLGPQERIDFGHIVLAALRNIPIVYHIGELAERAYHANPKKDVVIIIGANHVRMREFTNPIMLLNTREIEVIFQTGYGPISGELEARDRMNQLVSDARRFSLAQDLLSPHEVDYDDHGESSQLNINMRLVPQRGAPGRFAPAASRDAISTTVAEEKARRQTRKHAANVNQANSRRLTSVNQPRQVDQRGGKGALPIPNAASAISDEVDDGREIPPQSRPSRKQRQNKNVGTKLMTSIADVPRAVPAREKSYPLSSISSSSSQLLMEKSRRQPRSQQQAPRDRCLPDASSVPST